MWGGLLIEYHIIALAMVALGLALAMILAGQLAVGLKNRRRLIRRSTAVRTCMQVDRARMILMMSACLRSQASTRVRGVVTCRIIHCVFFFL